MPHTRELHIISGELNILRRTLHPLANMVNQLRDHRPARRTAPANPNMNPTINPVAIGHNSIDPMRSQTPDSFLLADRPHGADISPIAKVYLADVADHVLILTEEIDLLRGQVENMIDMVLDLISFYIVLI
jgi:Mg2+ and Co2+ transporter CorA